MERLVDGDRSVEDESVGGAAAGRRQDAPASGATDLFGTVAPEPAAGALHVGAWATIPETPVAAVAPPVVPPPAVPPPIPIQSGGFTQLLRALNYEQIKPEEKIKTAEIGRPETVMPVAAPGPTVPVKPIESAAVSSLTQLLRAFDGPEASSAARVEPVAPAVRDESAAQAALRAMDAPRSTPAPVSVAVSPQVTSFGQPARPAGEAAAAGSFTQMFQSLEGSAAKPAMQPGVSHPPQAAPMIEAAPLTPAATAPALPGSFTQMFEAAGPAGGGAPEGRQAVSAETATPPVSAPGSFTQTFRMLDQAPAVDHEALTQAVPLMADAPAVSSPGSFTQMFSAVAAESVPVKAAEPVPMKSEAAVPAPGSSEGSFTAVFRTLDAAPVPPAPVVSTTLPPAAAGSGPGSFTQMFSAAAAEPIPVKAAEPVPMKSEAAVPEPVPGSFTAVFRTLDATPAAHAAPAGVQPPMSSQSGAAQDQAGTFTQMFRTFDPPVDSPGHGGPAARSDPGSFTQMFGSAPAEPPRQPEMHAEPAGGASQMFATYQPPVQTPARAERPGETPGFASAPLPQAPASGGLTQLLRTLDAPSQPMAQAPPPAWDAAPATQPAGSFTAVYGRLDGSAGAVPAAAAPPASPPPYTPPVAAASQDATQAFRVPTAFPPAAAPVSAGPSEFTRILNASQLREQVLRGGEAPAGTAAPAAPSAAGAGLPAMNAPAMPSAPAMPQAPQWGAPAAAAPVAPAVPQMPAVPQPKAPEAPKVPVGAMQQYLPLLLILIIFLLLAILVAVIVLMKK